MKEDKRDSIAVVMLTLNEAHNLEQIFDNLRDWADEVFIVDSYSSDQTVEIALRRGACIVQRAFTDFGDQWNFALENLPINSDWTMKLDPDERLSNELKSSIKRFTPEPDCMGFSVSRRLWFMGRPLPVKQPLVRVWRTGHCRFTPVAVNEHPVVEGEIKALEGDLEHHDSPSLHHWYEKQNRYSTAEALRLFWGDAMAVTPKFFGNVLQRRMWLKQYLFAIPFRYQLIFLYNFLFLGAWRAGKVGYIWSKLRSDVYRAREYKLYEMKESGRGEQMPKPVVGLPDSRVEQF